MLARWQQLFQFMVVKYNDMIIKPTKKDGSFEKTPYGLGPFLEFMPWITLTLK